MGVGAGGKPRFKYSGLQMCVVIFLIIIIFAKQGLRVGTQQ